MYDGKVDAEATGLAKVLENKWYVDEIYQTAIVNPLIALGNVFKKYVEKSGIVQAVAGTGTLSYYISKNIKTVQTGNIGMYILLMIIGIVAGLGIFFFGIL